MIRVSASRLSFLGVVFFLAGAQEKATRGLYRSSVVGTEFDILRDGDPDVFERLEARGSGFPEMPDKRGGSPLRQEAFQFLAFFKDQTRVHMAVDADFDTEEAARKEALRYTSRLGRLPTALRNGVDRLVVHKGGRDTTAFSDVGLIVVYSENATKRIGTNDLEETLFHEAVHAAWDRPHRKSAGWLEAQKRDGRFVTDYAAKHPGGEDLAESALLAFALIHHPDRIPKADAKRIRGAIPARIEFVARLLPRDKPLHYRVEPNDERVEAIVDQSQRQARVCRVDLSKPGMMSDIVSNALMLGLNKPEAEVRSFLEGAETRYTSGDELLEASATKFGVAESVLREQVEAYHHCNCTHGDLEGPVDEERR